AERLGGTAAVRVGQSQGAAHERHRPRGVGRVRVRSRPDAPGDDALRHRQHSPFAGRRPQVSGAILKFSYNWIRELVPGLAEAPGPLERLITMKTAECEGVEPECELLARACLARVESVEPIANSHNVKAVVDAGPSGRKTVVCGAPNCRPGLITAWAAIGSKVIGGVESDGMLATAAELG